MILHHITNKPIVGSNWGTGRKHSGSDDHLIGNPLSLGAILE